MAAGEEPDAARWCRPPDALPYGSRLNPLKIRGTIDTTQVRDMAQTNLARIPFCRHG